jgi:hypothetical protein
MRGEPRSEARKTRSYGKRPKSSAKGDERLDDAFLRFPPSRLDQEYGQVCHLFGPRTKEIAR